MELPLVQLDGYCASSQAGVGLVSIKVEELQDSSASSLIQAIRNRKFEYDLLLHGLDGSDEEREICGSARRIFAASAEIASKLKPAHPEVVTVFAPGAPVHPLKEPVDCTLLTFGMAHKIRSEGYRRLAYLLERDSRTFRLEISTALHEGGTFDESFFTVSEEISAAFSGNVRFLGFLTDAEVSERLLTVDALVAFFPSGVRENNTTVLSAMSHGCPVISNLDGFSPEWMAHNKTIFDISQLVEFPQKSELTQVGDSGRLAASAFTFNRLAEILTENGR
jgi:glycosyltransferase involved in cell wall biosynthesis